MRKEADYQVTDRISLHIAGTEGTEANDMIEAILTSFGDMIMDETLSTLVPHISSPDTHKEVELDDRGVVRVQIAR